MIISTSIWWTIALICCGTTTQADELYVISVPTSISVVKNVAQSDILRSDISHLISYLMGFSSSEWNQPVQDFVKEMDIFNPPKANAMINVHLPNNTKLPINEYEMKYNVESDGSTPVSLLELNNAIERQFGSKSFIFDFENSNKMSAAFHTSHDIVLDFTRDRPLLDHGSCLDTTQDADAHFLAELESATGVVNQMSKKLGMVRDDATDSLYFAFTGLNRLARVYGENSCQVQAAVHLLQSFLPQFIHRLDTLYENNLLAEIVLSGPVRHSFESVDSRRRIRRQASPDTNPLPGGLVAPAHPDQAVVINIVAWLSVGMALAVLAAGHSLWFMDPGRDSIIYRMTTQRIKVD